jgi:SpoIID/LytB domain protein
MSILVPHLRRGVVVLVALLALSGGIAVRALRADASPGPGAVTFEGGGWGHGVGMSQYGAYGLAKQDGWTAGQILGHYYAGSELATLGEQVDAPTRLWVNLEHEAVAIDLDVRAIAGDAAALRLTRAGRTIEVAAGSSVTVTVVADEAGSLQCAIATGSTTDTGPCSIDAKWDGRAADPTTRIEFARVKRRTDSFEGARCTNADWNTSPTTYRTCSYSRGELRIRPDDNNASFHVVGVMNIEDYLLGISEMPYAWGLTSGGTDGAAALEAQAIAARTYAARRALDRGDPRDRANCWCHVVDTAADQRYVGWGHSGLGQQSWLDAVRRTAGVVVTHPGELRAGRPIPIEAFYSSSTYGRTEPSHLVFGSARPYLVSVDDTRAHAAAVGNPNSTWQQTLGVADLSRRLGWSGGRTVARVEIVDCSPSGAAAAIAFTDENGAATVRLLSQLRGLLGLRSPQVVAVDGLSPCSGPPAAPGSIAAGGLRIDDDAAGDSVGNGDGAAQCGETVELSTSINNGLPDALEDVAAELTIEDAYATVLHNSSSSFPAIAVGRAAFNEDDWDVRIAERTPDFHRIVLRLRLADSGHVLEWELRVTCADPAAAPYRVIDVAVDDDANGDSVGDGDGVPRCGETVELRVALRNLRDGPVTGVQASFAVDRGGTLLHNAASTYPDLDAGAAGHNADDYDVALDAVGGALRGWITITDDLTGTWRLPVRLPVNCAVDVELSTGSVAIDDGVNGDSRGNLDRRVQCGENVEIFVPLAASAPLRDVSVTLRTGDPYVTIRHNRVSAYPDLDANGSATNRDDWDLSVAEVVPDGHTARFRLVVRSGGRIVGKVRAQFPVECPETAGLPYRVAGLSIDDGVRGDSVGNGDGIANCGETIELSVGVEGVPETAAVASTLSSGDPAARILYNRASPMHSPTRGRFENVDDWDLAIAESLPARHRIAMVLEITVDGEPTRVPFALVTRCPVP